MLNIKIALEDDVNIDISDDDINISISETEAELGESETEITDIIEGINANCEVISNLKTLRTHITKFGVTKPFLHLVNSNGELSSALNILIPSCEEENIDQIDENDLPGTEIFVEAIEGTMNKVKEKIKKFFAIS